MFKLEIEFASVCLTARASSEKHDECINEFISSGEGLMKKQSKARD